MVLHAETTKNYRKGNGGHVGETHGGVHMHNGATETLSESGPVWLDRFDWFHRWFHCCDGGWRRLRQFVGNLGVHLSHLMTLPGVVTPLGMHR